MVRELVRVQSEIWKLKSFSKRQLCRTADMVLLTAKLHLWNILLAVWRNSEACLS